MKTANKVFDQISSQLFDQGLTASHSKVFIKIYGEISKQIKSQVKDKVRAL